MQARLGIDLRRGDPLVPEELLHLVQRHACVQQNGCDARTQAVRGDVLVNARLPGSVLDQPLDVSRSVFARAVAFENIAAPATVQIRAQFLRQSRENRVVAVAPTLGVGKVDLRRIECQMQVFDPDLNKLAHTGSGVEQHLHQEPVPAGMAIGGFDQPFDLGAIQSFHRSAALARRFQGEFPSCLFDDVFGLVVG